MPLMRKGIRAHFDGLISKGNLATPSVSGNERGNRKPSPGLVAHFSHISPVPLTYPTNNSFPASILSRFYCAIVMCRPVGVGGGAGGGGGGGGAGVVVMVTVTGTVTDEAPTAFIVTVPL